MASKLAQEITHKNRIRIATVASVLGCAWSPKRKAQVSLQVKDATNSEETLSQHLLTLSSLPTRMLDELPLGVHRGVNQVLLNSSSQTGKDRKLTTRVEPPRWRWERMKEHLRIESSKMAHL